MVTVLHKTSLKKTTHACIHTHTHTHTLTHTHIYTISLVPLSLKGTVLWKLLSLTVNKEKYLCLIFGISIKENKCLALQFGYLKWLLLTSLPLTHGLAYK